MMMVTMVVGCYENNLTHDIFHPKRGRMPSLNEGRGVVNTRSINAYIGKKRFLFCHFLLGATLAKLRGAGGLSLFPLSSWSSVRA